MQVAVKEDGSGYDYKKIRAGTDQIVRTICPIRKCFLCRISEKRAQKSHATNLAADPTFALVCECSTQWSDAMGDDKDIR